jgi:Methyltransferase domain
LTADDRRLYRDRCPVCGEDATGSLRTTGDHHSLEGFVLSGCRACGAYFIADPPRADLLGSYYDNEAGSAMHSRPSRLFATLRSISIGRDLRPLLSRLAPGEPVIDFGTGDGSVARYLHDRGFAVQAIDLYDPSEWSTGAIPYRQYAIGTAHLETQQFMVGGRPAAAVVLRHVLEHLIEPRESLEVARAAGVRYVLAIVPNASSRLARVFGENWYYWDPPRHLTAFTPASLRRLAANTGFQVAELTTSGVDEVITSAHRSLLLSGAARSAGWRRWVAHITRPTGNLAGLSSASTALFADSVCRVLLAAEDAAVSERR